MKHTLFVLGVCCWTASLVAEPRSAAEKDLQAKLPDIFAKSAEHYRALDAAATPLMKDAKGNYRTPHGFRIASRELDMESIFWWTSGHFPGSLWYLYEATKDDFFKQRATAWTEILAPVAKYDGNHDVGFMMWCSFGNARRLLNTKKYDDLLKEAATTLCTRYNEKLGLIRSWGKLTDEKTFLVIPDNMMNLELLESVTYLLAGDARFDKIARSHADVTMKHHFRADGGCFHVVNYDHKTGRVMEVRRGQGASCETAWSRGQSWAIYGYTMMHRMTTERSYLDFACKLADYAIKHPNMPDDGIPYWDYGAPGEERDSSAGSIMASGLLELSELVGGKRGAAYRAFAVKQLLSLSSDAYFSKGDEIGHFLLKQGTGNRPGNSEVNVPLDYGDYYYLEALVRFRKLVEKPVCGFVPPAELSDEMYLDFKRNGNRTRYQKPYFDRVKQLSRLVRQECEKHDGKAIPGIVAYLKAICAERCWTMPAHDVSLACFNGTRLQVDLGCGARGLELVQTLSKVGDKLPADVVAMTRKELERRFFGPYLESCRGVKIEPHWWFHGDNNWNAVCHSDVVRAALLYYPKDAPERAEIIKGALSGVPYFLSGFTPDGYCSEGAGYWNYGYGHFLLMGEALRNAPEKVDLFADPKTRKIAAYGFDYKLTSVISPRFADGGGTPDKKWLVLCKKIWPDLDNGPLAIRSVFPDAQVWIARPAQSAKKGEGLSVGWKGGHNGEFHNHNDVGSYNVAIGDVIVSGDPDGEVYTARTFSKNRYVSKVLSSYAHPVPRVAGQLQQPGKQFAGKVLKQDFTDACDTLTLDLKGAYAPIPTLVSLVRTFRYDRAHATFTVEDEVTYSEPTAFAVPLVTTGVFTARGASRKDVTVRIDTQVEGGDWSWKRETVDNPGKPSPQLKIVDFPSVKHAKVTSRFTVL